MMIKSLILILLLTSCAHQHDKDKNYLVEGQCENEFYQTKLGPGENVWKNVTEKGGTGASYLITGLAYSTDFIVSFSGGVISSLTVCSPLIALEGITRSNGLISSKCLENVGLKAYEEINPKLGPKAQKLTETWSCPDLEPISKGLLRVAQCYEKNGEKVLAKTQVKQMQNSTVLTKCLSSETQEKIATYSNSLN